MSFAIEVPGEANPLTPHELVHALQAATSTDLAQRQTAGKQLESWVPNKEFFPLLQTAFLDKSLPHEIRFLAIIQLKNGIDRYWRNNSLKSSIPSDARDLIRPRLFQGTVDEEDKGLALHNALVVAKIVRVDYPNSWPDALSNVIDLLRTARNGNQMQLGGALLILLRVVKELSTARLRRSQTALQSVTPEMVVMLAEIYTENITQWIDFLTKGRGDEDVADLAMQNSLISLKILRRLVVLGYEQPHDDDVVKQFWSLSQLHFGQFLNHVSHDSIVPAPYQDVVGKHLLQFTKLHIDMCEKHAASFAALPDSLPLVHAYWDLVAKFAEVFDKSGGIRQSTSEASTEAKSKVEGPLLERLALRGLLLLGACVRIVFQPMQTFKYRSFETKKEQEQAVKTIGHDLLTNDFVVQIVNVIITHLFIFRKSDLDAWEEDPEEWEQQEQNQGNAWEWEVRPCAEKLFLHLLIHYKTLICPPLLSYFQTATAPDADIIAKESVYTAMGLVAANLPDVYDFETLLRTTLINDAQQQGPHHKILRRRIAILLSQWVPVKMSVDGRPLVYEIFRHFLNPQDQTNDEVVRITAARQFRWVADSFNFEVQSFMPFGADILSQLIDVLQKVENDDTRLAILETIHVIVQRLDAQSSQFGDYMMSTLPAIWDAAGAEEYMIKQSIMSILGALVMAMKAASQRYHQFIVPLLRQALQPDTDMHLHLIEESAELWEFILLQSTPPLSPNLTSLVELGLPLVEYESETAFKCLQVVENYILLAPQAMLGDQYRRPTVVALAKALDNKSREHTKLAAICLDLLVRAAEELEGPAGVSVVVQSMHETGLLQKMLGALHEDWEASQTTGPNRKTTRLSAVAKTDYLAILARIALADPAIFAQMLASFGGLETAWSWLSAEWFGNFDAMADINHQKLSCLALTRLLELPEPMHTLVLGKLQDYFSMWTSVVSEMRDGLEGDGDNLVLREALEPTEWDTAKTVREREIGTKDPVKILHTFNFVKERLQHLVQRAGGEGPFERDWAINVDRDVLAGFQRLSDPQPRVEG